MTTKHIVIPEKAGTPLCSPDAIRGLSQRGMILGCTQATGLVRFAQAPSSVPPGHLLPMGEEITEPLSHWERGKGEGLRYHGITP